MEMKFNKYYSLANPSAKKPGEAVNIFAICILKDPVMKGKGYEYYDSMFCSRFLSHRKSNEKICRVNRIQSINLFLMFAGLSLKPD